METTKKQDYRFDKLPIDKERRVNDRELLTFTNLTNLKWEFLDYSSKEGDLASEETLKLNDILKDPERFVRGYRDPVKKQDPIYVYGNDISGNYLGKEEGIKELKEAAGIAMEYLEKDEGKFLEEWEVVYGADNYKLVTDYLDYIKSIFDPNSSEEIYPDRDELKNMRRNQKLIKLTFTVAEGVLSVTSNYISSKVKGPESFIGKVSLGFSKTALKDLLKETESLPLQLIGAVLLNTDKIEPKMIINILKDSASPISKYLQDELKYDVDETIKKLQENTLTGTEEKKMKEDIIKAIEDYLNSLNMKAIQSLSLDDTGFRVLVLKKGNDVVIAYKGNSPDSSKLLPDEFYNLHIVYDLIKRKDFFNENTKITFTGYEGGADLSFLNSLIVDENNFCTSHFFYNTIHRTEEYLNFTEKHIDKDYKTNIEIVFSGGKKFAESTIKRTTYAIIAAKLKGIKLAAGIAGIKIALIALLLWLGIKAIREFINSARIRRIYNKLKELELLRRNDKINPLYSAVIEERIEGYITDRFLKNDYISVKLNSGRVVKIKKEDALYLISEEILDKIKEDEDGLLSVYDLDIMIGGHNRALIKLANNGKYYETMQITDNYLLGSYGGPLRVTHDLNEEEIEKRLVSGHTMNSIMEMVAGLQGSYIKRAGKIRFVFYDKKDFISREAGNLFIEDNIYLLKDKIVEKNSEVDSIIVQFLKAAPESRGMGEILEKAIVKVNEFFEKMPGETLTNEFIFWPYINKEGYLRKELREDYIISAFKSMLQYSYEDDSYVPKRVKYENKDKLYEYRENFQKWFVKKDVYEIFLKRIKNIVNIIFVHSSERYSQYKDSHAAFNHFRAILKWLEENKDKLDEKFYQISTQEQERLGGLFTRVIGEIIINPEANKRLEYKYNPYDFITGGSIKINAVNLPETTAENEEKIVNYLDYIIIRETELGRKALMSEGINFKNGETLKAKCSQGEENIKAAELGELLKKA